MENDINKKITIEVEVTTDGQQQINQYKAALDSLRISITGLSDPFKGLSNSISNLDRDVDKLTGAVDKLSNQNKALGSSGNKVKETINDIVSTFGSWKTIIDVVKTGVISLEDALSGGLAVLTIFLPEIINWFGELLKGNTTLSALNKTLKDNKLVMDALNQVRAQGRDNAQQELVHLKLLYSAGQDQNLSLKERKKIVAELQSQYPGYFGNMSSDAIFAGKAAKSYNELTKAIIATARAKAAEDLIMKNQVRQFGNDDNLQKLKTNLAGYKKQLAVAQKEYNAYTTHPATGGGTFATGDTEEAALYQNLARIRDIVKDTQKSIDNLNTDSTILTRRNDVLAKAALADTEKYGVGVLGVTKATNHQIINITRNTIKEQQKLYRQAEQKNNTIQTVQPPENSETPSESKFIDPGTSPGMNFDDSFTREPAGGFKTELIQKEIKLKKTAIQQVEDYAKQSGARVATDALKTLDDSIKQQAEAKVVALEKNKAAELTNTSLTSTQKLAIENKYKIQENAIKAKAFKEEQKLSIAQAIINGAQAVTKVTAQSGILAPLEIGVVVAETAAQIAKIASQKAPAYAKGGLHYSSDGRGGVLPGYSRTDNTNAYLRSGEGVVVSEAMQVPWARNLVSAINVGFGGRDFSITNPGRAYAVGGIFTDGGDANRYYNQPVNDQKNLANTIAYQMINNFPPVYVDVKDINSQQNILAQTINRVNL
ncbi:MAG: hypothetical protein M3O71_26155 [Bacteroidota bacterium]|nr:hypothetical protein [Bacteroidota bacterium]